MDRNTNAFISLMKEYNCLIDAGGKFQPDGDSLIRVEIKTNPKTTRLSSPLTLFFRPSTRASMQFQCFQWNSGRWMTGDCWYLGRHNDSEVCQCISGGIYALFRKHERKLDVTFYISDIPLPFIKHLSPLKNICFILFTTPIFQYDFTMMGGCLFVALIVLLCFGFLTIFFYSRVRYSTLFILILFLYIDLISLDLFHFICLQ